MIIMLKDFEEIQEVTLELRDSKEQILEIAVTHNGEYITQVEACTNQG